jgi:signal transduction histidine kinase/CheY-like chemotaxis protein
MTPADTRPVSAWVAPFIWLLLLTLVLLGWVQWRQYQLLYDTSNRQVDRLMWQAAELMRERDRLAGALRDALAPGAVLDIDHVSERYEVFVSRIDLIDRIPRRDLLETSPVYRHTMGALRTYVEVADRVMTDLDLVVQEPQRLALLLTPLQPLENQLFVLTAHAHTASQLLVTERSRQLRQQSQLLLMLGLAQGILLLLLLGILMRRIRQQNARYAHLRMLSNQLTQARDRAMDANHAKDVFLATMSHELRTPFQGLMGMLQLLRDSRLNEQQRDYLETARHSAKHLLGVLNDILDISTIETGSLKLVPAPTPLRMLLEQVEALMQGAAQAKGLELKVDIDPELPAWVMTDAKRLRQVLFNLLGNAIKFTRSGGVYADIRRDSGPAGRLRIIIRDTGIGMDKATVSKLFTRFYQADSSLRRRIGGTGLGLEISRNLVRLMDGDISVESQLGVGSVFTVTLTLPPTEAPQRRQSARQRQETPSLRLLMAEDNAVNRKVMMIMADRLGHQVSFCENGEEALQRLQQPGAVFDAVLMDYHMPVLDGLATTEAIRAMPGALAHIPIIMVTADVLNNTRAKAMKAGVTEFVTKPMQPEDLQRAFKHCGLLPSFADSGMSVLGGL